MRSLFSCEWPVAELSWGTRSWLVIALASAASACTCGVDSTDDTYQGRDAGRDAGAASSADAGLGDAGVVDAGTDAGAVDAGTDAGAVDAGIDAGMTVSDAGGFDDGGAPICRCSWSGVGILGVVIPCGATLCTGAHTDLSCDQTGLPVVAASCSTPTGCVCTLGQLSLACGTDYCTGDAIDDGGSSVDTHPGHGWSCGADAGLTVLPSCTFVF